ncbi:hypothetical protein EHW99_2635 [Erwinia amylovora]|nr:hypothetical protein EHX00_2635 [Erwinia amylovora]QJQ59036.1 hypothetical protein EHW99_2635 [Erwinia amylovora]QJQ62735.1 hypothetical protein EHW98_2635 [Erwinia amylovora]QJQ66537.1 hypothetical protein EHW96_2635 [Erwinia amylovora]QJQ70236.1 hypothetical protein EGZ89_2635 [Erwinia amylovora]
MYLVMAARQIKCVIRLFSQGKASMRYVSCRRQPPAIHCGLPG